MNVSPTAVLVGSHWFISWNNVNPTNNAAVITLRPLSPNVRIGGVSIVCSTSAGDTETVQLSLLPNSSTGDKFLEVGNISEGGPPAFTISQIVATGTIFGNIEAQSISSVETNGNITANFATTRYVPASGQPFPFTNTDIGVIESLNGNITGNIDSCDKVEAVYAFQGTIGTSTAPVTIRSTTDTGGPGDLIRFIEAKSVYANISTPDLLVRVKTTGTAPGQGDFVGSINARRIAGGADPGVYGLDIARDLKAKIILTGSLATDTNDEFIIGGSFPDGGYINGVSNYRITLPAGRFTRQMIVNRSNNATNTWSGQVKVGSTLLSDQPYYSNTSALLGNQAIGLMPFMVHYNECEPTGLGTPGVALTGCNYHATGYTRTSITIEHYGQVGYRNSANNGWQSTPPAGTQGIIVERKRVDDCTANWTDISSSFSVAVDANNARSIIITGPFASAPLNESTWLYRIRPMRTTASGQAPLRCREPLDNPSAPIVGDYTYVYLADGVEDIPGGGLN